MKPALFYAIRRNSLYMPIVAVTSTKPSQRGVGKWYGRTVKHNEATNGLMNDLSGRFDTLEEAEAHHSKIAEITKRYNAQRDVLGKQISALYRAERDEIDALT